MFVNLRPFARRDFRLLYIGQIVSFLGSMITYVAMPWQIYELTHSTMLVGLLGTVQLVPVLVFALIGGSLADRMDRRVLLIGSELVMAACSLGLVVNSTLHAPNVLYIFVAAGVMQAANGFHRPAMEAMTQLLIPRDEYAAIGVLNSFRYSFGAIVGPAFGGFLIAEWSIATAYLVDVLTFVIAMVTVYYIQKMPKPEPSKTSGSKILEGLRFALSRQELMGTYIVDIIAMTFAFPTALFPAMGDAWGGAKAAGLLFSAMSLGSLVVTIFSGWTSNVKFHGKAVIYSAAAWGVAVVALGFSRHFHLALIFLVVAGAADALSGIFRQVIWSETIPNNMRGRLAGIEMISYMTGPLLGNTRAGWVASVSTIPIAVVSGGLLCTVGVVMCIRWLPEFWRYKSSHSVLSQ